MVKHIPIPRLAPVIQITYSFTQNNSSKSNKNNIRYITSKKLRETNILNLILDFFTLHVFFRQQRKIAWHKLEHKIICYWKLLKKKQKKKLRTNWSNNTSINNRSRKTNRWLTECVPSALRNLNRKAQEIAANAEAKISATIFFPFFC